MRGWFQRAISVNLLFITFNSRLAYMVVALKLMTIGICKRGYPSLAFFALCYFSLLFPGGHRTAESNQYAPLSQSLPLAENQYCMLMSLMTYTEQVKLGTPT